MARPGSLNTIADVAGVFVGSAEDARARTGVTVIAPQMRCVAAVDVRGGGPGTRETDLLAAENLVDAIDAIVLSGGSVYGLGAADAVVSILGASGRGFVVAPGIPVAPIVPGAILFDLANGGDKSWGASPPYPHLGAAALGAANRDVRMGSVGAGTGARAGALKGGLGSASLVLDGITIGAIAAVNSWGSVVMPGSSAFWAWPFEIDGEFGAVRPAPDYAPQGAAWGLAKSTASARENTTLAVIATDAALTPAQAKRVAIMAQDGLARAIRPVHAPFDGDCVFVLSTGAAPLEEPAALAIARIGAAAADTLARAVARGVYFATSDAGERCWRDL